MPSDPVDVIVVGGGLSGLAAARRLTSGGLNVRVLEARDRLGGRTNTVQHAGHTIDVGGQWVGPGQDRVLALIEELDVRTYPQFTKGKQTVEIDGKITRYRGLIPKIGLRALVDLGLGISKIESAIKKVSPHAPWEADNAADLDEMSVKDWMDNTFNTNNAKQIIRAATNAIMAEEPERISWLHMLMYSAAAGGFENLIEVKGGAQQDRIYGGAQQLSEKLAAIGGAEILLSQPVSQIAQTDEGVEVVAGNSAVHRARFSILALAPSMCESIAFTPTLPDKRKALHAKMNMGSASKCIVGYKEPFWRKNGLNGEGVGNGEWGRLFFDVCSEDASTVGLVAFVFSDAAKEFAQKPEPERQALIVADLVRLFGPQAAKPEWYIDKNWSEDEYAGGCYTGLFSPGDVTRLGAALRAPCGLLHFAGTEAATKWPGYMDGAIESGQRAADEILART